MFHRKYKIKTSTTIKGSERRKLRSLLENEFPSLSEADLNSLISNKNEMTQVKALTYSGAVAMVYYSGANPIFFVVESRCFPTVYTLWNFPNLLPTVSTAPIVLEKINNGADLMAPGVILNEATIGELGDLRVNDVCSVRLYGNGAPVAVGTSQMSKEEILVEGRKGKAVIIAHSYNDTLWSSGDKSTLPVIADNYAEVCDSDDEETDQSQQTGVTTDGQNDIDSLESNCLSLNLNQSVEENKNGQTEVTTEQESEGACDDNQYSMDDLLYMSFMTAMKIYGKKITLPVLTSTFYKSHVLPCCPSHLNLDVKKSTYKKLSVFLKKMEGQGLIKIKELSKGVESITEVNTNHEGIEAFHITPLFADHLKMQKAEKTEDSSERTVQESYKFPEVVELLTVTAQVRSIFEACNIRKGEAVTTNKVREVLRDYVKLNSLQNENNPREVTLDPVLSNSLLSRNDTRTTMSWEQLYDVTATKMQHAYQITFEGGNPVLKKGKLEPIDISVAKRTGNKKVTLIHNLETFGIDPEKLAHHAQVAVAASTSVTPCSNGKGTQVLIQGSQLQYLNSLFNGVYRVPKKYIRGLENLPKKKK